MFDRFTRNARKSMGYAREEAQRYKNDCIGPEHVALGVLAVSGATASEMLRELGIDMSALVKALRRIPREGDVAEIGQIPFTPAAKRVLEQSLYAARMSAVNYIGTEHLLAGVAAAGGEPAAVLATFDVTADALIEMLPRGDEPAEPTGMFELFSERSRLAMGIARHECERLCHDDMDAQHIAVGVVLVPGSSAARVLQALGVDELDFAKALRASMPEPLDTWTGQLPFTPAAKKVLERARDEADGMITTAHLLLGAMAECGPVLGVTEDAVREKITG